MNCELCGLPMPPSEQMFKLHGYSGPCPGPVIRKVAAEPASPKPFDIAIEALTVIAKNRFADDPVDMKQLHKIAAEALKDIAEYVPVKEKS